MKPATPDHWQHLKALFGEALGRPPEQRAAYLDEACSGDDRLRDDLGRLLDAHERAAGFLGALDPGGVAALVSAEEAPPAPQEAIGPYRILGELGSGGMGVVYRAHDPRLDRSVALKVLPPYRAADARAKARLVAEARAASALDHPNICTVYETGETDAGQLYIAMACYEGETLREHLGAGPLPVEEARDLARQVARALAAAHRRGIVHRDIKPSNIALVEGEAGRPHVKLLDFGIAKAEGGEPTQEGAARGTVAYMSPEQVRGRAADARSDLWSLGVVLYEMLTGQRPFRGADDQAVIYGIRHDAPKPVERLRPGVPADVAHAVGRLLQKDPAQRYPDAESFERDLDPHRPAPPRGSGRRGVGTVLAVALVLGAVIAGLALWPGSRESGEVPGLEAGAEELAPRRLAVLPFSSLGVTGEPYLADGVTEGLIARLSRLSGLHVIAHSSVAGYGGSARSPAEAGRDLGVDVIVEGSVRDAGGRVHSAVRLLDAHTDTVLWAEQYEVGYEEGPRLQGAIAEGVLGALGVTPRREELLQLAGARTSSAEAYEAYLKGRYHWHRRDPESLEQARAYFQHALDLDPTYAEAWAGLADTYDLLISADALTPSAAVPLARAAAERGLALDPSLAEAHTALGSILMSYFWSWEQAGHHLQRAVHLGPSYALAHQRYAGYLAISGRFDEAIEAAEHAQALDPLSLYTRAGTGWILYLSGRYDSAIPHLRETIALDPAFGLAHLNLGLAYLQTGDVDEAVAAFETLQAVWGERPVVLGLLGYGYAKAGASERARALLVRLKQQAPPAPFHEAILQVGLGRYEEALDALERAADQRSGMILYVGVEPLMEPLHPYPRFRALLERMGLEGGDRDV